MPAIISQSIAPRIRRLLSADTFARPSAGSLRPSEVKLLAAVARGERATEGLSRHRAISALAAAGSPQAAIPVLEQLASNREAQRTNRVAAVRGLGRIATPDAQEFLLRHTDETDPRVQQAAFAALGLFAGRSALDTMETLSAPADEAVRRQLFLTRALITHREGINGPFLPEGEGSSRESVPAPMNNVSLIMQTAADTAAGQARFRGPTYGIRIADQSYFLRCGRAEWTMFVNSDLGPVFTANERLFERPWIAALLARWLPPGVAATTQYLVLTRPVEARVRIDVVRADGEVMYTGSAETVGSGLSFTISDVDRPQTAPTHLSGLMSSEDVRLDVAMVSGTRVATREAEVIRTSASSN